MEHSRKPTNKLQQGHFAEPSKLPSLAKSNNRKLGSSGNRKSTSNLAEADLAEVEEGFDDGVQEEDYVPKTIMMSIFKKLPTIVSTNLCSNLVFM